LKFKFIPIIVSILFFSIGEIKASALGIPDSDTGLLISLVSNTAQQLTQLEQLINETDKHTKLFRDSIEQVEERYEVVEQLQSMADNYARIATSRPSDLSEINDTLESLKDQKERVKELIAKTRRAERESDQIKSDNKNVDSIVSSDNLIAKKQMAKSFGKGTTFSKNMDRVNAQNTSLILKETVSLNGGVNTTNGLLATQNNLSTIQVNQIIGDMKSKNNALVPITKSRSK
jgi:small-conductance mechanosensitive channel